MWHKAKMDKSVSCSVAPMVQSEPLNDSFGSDLSVMVYRDGTAAYPVIASVTG
jgi:hypothetical protein